MPWDPYFSCYFHLWLTILHLRLTTFDFFEIPAPIFLLSGRTACNLAPLCMKAQMLCPIIQIRKFEIQITFQVEEGSPICILQYTLAQNFVAKTAKFVGNATCASTSSLQYFHIRYQVQAHMFRVWNH